MTEIKQPKILLVDDDRFLLDMFVLRFKKSNIEADTASGSISALEKLRKGSDYNIILLDIIMPGMDGLEFLKTIRAEKLVPNAVIIMLTNNTDDSEKARVYKVDDYIIKSSMVPSEVVNRVLEVYKKKNSR